MVLVIDPQVAGVSGDMILSCLVDLGASREKIISGIKSFKFTESHIDNISFVDTIKNGIRSTSLDLDIEESYTCSAIDMQQAVINTTKSLHLSPMSTSFAKSCIEKLISAEAKVHGLDITKVHLHETASIDTLIDIVGTAIALDDLDLFNDTILCMPVCIGNGTFEFSHGTMSNPSSAVLEIFKGSGMYIQGSNISAELATPTGAAIISSIAKPIRYYPQLQVISVGYGAGQRDHKTFANVLKMVRGNSDSSTYNNYESVTVLETNVDDVSGEILGNLVDHLMSNGAHDVSMYNGITKKSRSTTLISIVCDHNTADALIDILISDTGTLGVRISSVDRIVVPRTIHTKKITLYNQTFTIHYKRSSFKGRKSSKIEFDDLLYISNKLDKSIKDIEYQVRKEIEEFDKT